MSGLRHAEEWWGDYRGIRYIVRSLIRKPWPQQVFHEDYVHADGFVREWTHYIALHENQVPEEHRSRFFLPHRIEQLTPGGSKYVLYDYSDSAFAHLEWHGGITYYGIECDIPGHRAVRAGCDYQHSWDDGCIYDLEDVEREAKRTIDSLWEQHPYLLVRCGYDGSYHAPADMEPCGDGWISKEGKAKRDAAVTPAPESRA